MNRMCSIAVTMGMLLLQGGAMNRLDEMFTTGPETLVAKAGAIVSGPVSHYSREVKEESKGAAPIALRWTVSGQLDKPEVLRGAAPPGAVRFRREERSPFLPVAEPLPLWEQEFAQWQPDDKAIVFYSSAKPPVILKVLPSGTGNRDLISLVRLIVSVPASGHDASAQAEAWRQQLESNAASLEIKKVALRSLMKLTREWSEVSRTLRAVMAGADPGLRSFTYGLVAYEMVHQKWTDQSEPASFLCDQLAKLNDTDLAETYLQYLDMVLRFAGDEDSRSQRKPMRDQLRSCLKEQCLQASAPIAAACKETLGRHPR